MDETLALPTEEAVQVALRTQQVLAYETGAPNVTDPLGGSYYIEALTDQLEREAESLFEEIDQVGGVVRGLETAGSAQIAESAARRRGRSSSTGACRGVNDSSRTNPKQHSISGLARTPRRRSGRRWPDARRARRRGASRRSTRSRRREGRKTSSRILECARRYCTLYEIRAALRTCSAIEPVSSNGYRRTARLKRDEIGPKSYRHARDGPLRCNSSRTVGHRR